MKLIFGEKHQCAAAAFAMVLEMSLEEMLKALGHNGLEQICDEPEPNCYRGFHPQEFVDLCWNLGRSVVMIEKVPEMIHGETVVNHSNFLNPERFNKYMQRNDGVLYGVNETKIGHAVAWCRDELSIYDPRGYTYPYQRGIPFEPLQFFIVR